MRGVSCLGVQGKPLSEVRRNTRHDVTPHAEYIRAAHELCSP